jgi:hypothetical protein
MPGSASLDLFYQEKYLLNHVDLKIKLRRSRDAFALMVDADNYKIKIKDLALFVRNVQLNPAPPFFLTIVVVQNVPLLMTESSITVHATNHQSFRQLSQKHVVL